MNIGDEVTFTPCAFVGFVDGKALATFDVPRKVTGTVDYINEAHRWYRVRYVVFGNVLHEGFKF